MHMALLVLMGLVSISISMLVCFFKEAYSTFCGKFLIFFEQSQHISLHPVFKWFAKTKPFFLNDIFPHLSGFVNYVSDSDKVDRSLKDVILTSTLIM